MFRSLLLACLVAAPAVAQTADVIIEINGKDPRPKASPPSPARSGDRSLLTLPAPQKPLPAEKVRPLIDALSSPDYKTREKASKDLLAADSRVLPHLTAALDAADSPEAERRLEVLIGKIKLDRVTKATRVTVKANGETPKAVLKDICRQAGYTFSGELPDTGRVKLDLEDVPFWEAVEKVAGMHGLSVQTTFDAQDRGILTASASDTVSPFNAVSGPFRFVPQNVSTSKSVQLSELPRKGELYATSESLSLNGQVWAEPKLPVVAVGSVRLTKATDDQGGSMLDPNGGDRPPDEVLPDNNYYRTLNPGFSLYLVRTNKEAKSIKELKGVLPVVVLVDVRVELEIEDILKVKGKKFAGRSVDIEVEEVTQAKPADGGGVTAKLTLTPRTTPADGDTYSWWSTVPQRLVLLDEDGTRFQSNGTNEQKVEPATVTVTVQFSPPEAKRKAKPVSLVLTYWVTAQQDVEFTLKNIPLP